MTQKLQKSNPDHFALTQAGKLSPEGQETKASAPLSEDQVQKVMELRYLVRKLHVLDTLEEGTKKGNAPKADPLMEMLAEGGLVSEKLLAERRNEAESGGSTEILKATVQARVRELLQDDQVRAEYRSLFQTYAKEYQKLRKLLKAYKSGTLISKRHTVLKGKKTPAGSLEVTTTEKNIVLKAPDKAFIARELVELLEGFQKQCEDETQNIHNQRAQTRSDYDKTDELTLQKLEKYYQQCDLELNELRKEPSIVLQMRIDEVLRDRKTLKKIKCEDQHPLKKSYLRNGFIETKHREAIMFGKKGAENSVIASLRAKQNVELLGPTGTGKTKLAIRCAWIYAQKYPIIVSGGPGVYRSTFFGAPSDLGKRDPGAVIKCMNEGRVLIIDEDNRIDPIQMAEIKLILGLKAGDSYVHPDTGEEITIQEGFGIIVTRNEKGLHHQDRYDLPPDYRREFTHGSFEIDYYTPEEMYYRFLLPKLVNEKGGLDLSPEEVGGKINTGESSPLLTLVRAAHDIQEAYKKNELDNAVFESGYLIGLFDSWPEAKRKKKPDGSKITFLDFIETKLIEFIKRPIGNKDREVILKKLIYRGFFQNRQGVTYTAKTFSTANEGDLMTEAQYQTLFRGLARAFKDPGFSEMTPQQVARLDPFDVYRIPEPPPHPMEGHVNTFRKRYKELCDRLGVLPVAFAAESFDEHRDALLQSLCELMSEAKMSNASAVKRILEAMAKKGLEDFLKYTLKIDAGGKVSDSTLSFLKVS